LTPAGSFVGGGRVADPAAAAVAGADLEVVPHADVGEAGRRVHLQVAPAALRETDHHAVCTEGAVADGGLREVERAVGRLVPQHGRGTDPQGVEVAGEGEIGGREDGVEALRHPRIGPFEALLADGEVSRALGGADLERAAASDDVQLAPGAV